MTIEHSSNLHHSYLCSPEKDPTALGRPCFQNARIASSKVHLLWWTSPRSTLPWWSEKALQEHPKGWTKGLQHWCFFWGNSRLGPCRMESICLLWCWLLKHMKSNASSLHKTREQFTRPGGTCCPLLYLCSHAHTGPGTLEMTGGYQNKGVIFMGQRTKKMIFHHSEYQCAHLTSQSYLPPCQKLPQRRVEHYCVPVVEGTISTMCY